MKIVNIWIVILCLCTSALYAQIAGNPIETKGEGEWTISAAGTFLQQMISSETATSNRFLVKSSWGIADWLDLYGIGGISKLGLEVDQKNVSNYEGKYEFTYGVGFNMTLKSISDVNRLGIWCSVQAIRFPSKGNFVEFYEGTDESLYHEYQMQYDWKEVHIHIGIIYPYQQFRFYFAGTGYFIHRDDNKKEYIVYGDEITYWGEKKEA